eukprot:jgi/Bigna1/72642/fgenesh1_pg.20_\
MSPKALLVFIRYEHFQRCSSFYDKIIILSRIFFLRSKTIQRKKTGDTDNAMIPPSPSRSTFSSLKREQREKAQIQRKNEFRLVGALLAAGVSILLSSYIAITVISRAESEPDSIDLQIQSRAPLLGQGTRFQPKTTTPPNGRDGIAPRVKILKNRFGRRNFSPYLFTNKKSSTNGDSEGASSKDRSERTKARWQWDGGPYEFGTGGPYFMEIGDKYYKIRRFTPRNTPLWWFGGGKDEATMRFEFAEAEPWFTQPAYEGQDWNITYWVGVEKKTPRIWWKFVDFLPTILPLFLYALCFRFAYRVADWNLK